MTPARNSPRRHLYFPGFVLDQVGTKPEFSLHRPLHLLPDLDQRVPFLLRETRGRRRSGFRPNPSRRRRRCRRITIPSIDSPGVQSVSLQFRKANNLLFQETQTKLSGRHTFRYGVEFLRQLATQRPAARYLGELIYTNAVGYSAFANFLDDFSGPSGRAQKDFGATVFHPNQFRQTYFFQDTWLPAPSLSLTLGLRYENFGQPANALRYPAFAGFDPDNFLKPNRVNTDNNNFGPAFGLAWSPSFRSGWLGKAVWGRQNGVARRLSNQLRRLLHPDDLALLATSTPNAISTDHQGPQRTGRGSAELVCATATCSERSQPAGCPTGRPRKELSQPLHGALVIWLPAAAFEQTRARWLLRGSESHKLTTWADMNPQQPDGQRLHPDFGPTGHSHEPGQFVLPRHAMARGPPLCARVPGDGVLYLVAEHGQHQRRSRRRSTTSVSGANRTVGSTGARRAETRSRAKRL